MTISILSPTCRSLSSQPLCAFNITRLIQTDAVPFEIVKERETEVGVGRPRHPLEPVDLKRTGRILDSLKHGHTLGDNVAEF